MIELERYQTDHMARENRLCPLCKSKQIEHENNFLFQCQEYSLLTKAFWLNTPNQRNGTWLWKETITEIIKFLMNSIDWLVFDK